ncbi:hypothetical protein [Streptomyces candidus]|uniref:hypothetical protein n=1 Tax=Streptomyces candidus TaxID=67283 RepID=UPI003570BFF7
MRAWRSSGRFEGRSALRTWVYRIANVQRVSGRPRIRQAAGAADGPVRAKWGRHPAGALAGLRSVSGTLPRQGSGGGRHGG